MRSIINIILVVCLVFIIFEFILACVSYKNREKIIAFFKKRKTWSVAGILMALIALIPVGFIILYAVVTPMLMVIRGDCFVGYYVSSDVIFYNDSYYVKVIDENKLLEINNYGNGYWEYTDTFISSDEVTFPYVEYWVPKSFFERIVTMGEKDDKYIILSSMEEQWYYERR